MKKGYLGLWLILVLSLGIFFFISSLDSVNVFGVELKPSKMYSSLVCKSDSDSIIPPPQPKLFPQPVDTASQSILFIGDSMLEGLYPRLAAYADENGHELRVAMWYSSTSQIWGECDTLTHFINKVKPSYIFICLGANELFVKDIAEKRDKYVKNILKQIGDIPYLWIGPPNWKPDTGINKLIAKNTKKGCFFLSDGMTFDRAKDGAHPTRQSAIVWMDSIVRWMPDSCLHPIRMNLPKVKSSRAKRVYALQPKK